MEQNFICFQSKVTLFLIPLEAVYHIIPGRQNTEDPLSFLHHEVEAVNFACLWDPQALSVGKYAILLREGDEPFGILAEEISGVFELSRSRLFELPNGVFTPRSTFIKGAVYLKPLDSWAFLVDPLQIFALKEGANNDSGCHEGLMDRGDTDGNHKQAEDAADTDGRSFLSVSLGDLREEVPFDQVAAILPTPKLLQVPGAPPQNAGVLFWGGRFLAVRYPMDAVSRMACVCAVIVRGADADLYGIAADHITGGGQLDSLYR